MILQTLLRDISLQEFLDKYLHRVPFAQPGGGEDFIELGTWSTLERILARPDPDRPPDTLVVKEGELFGQGAPTAVEARALRESGHTIVVRNAERHDPGLEGLSRRFRDVFSAPINVHLYCTPASQYGFGWHYDAEDVFILQTRGSKEYSVRKNTVNPWPLVGTIPQDMMYEREKTPIMTCMLEPGDWLYLPPGYWHRTKAREESVSLAIGVLSHSAIDLYDFLRPLLLRSPLWRQRLPIAGRTPEQQEELVKDLLPELARDLQSQFPGDELAEDFLERVRRR